ncbi:MAG: hypothetical protein ACOC3W_12485 [Thermodesulfobacteriota bacterium]
MTGFTETNPMKRSGIPDFRLSSRIPTSGMHLFFSITGIEILAEAEIRVFGIAVFRKAISGGDAFFGMATFTEWRQV